MRLAHSEHLISSVFAVLSTWNHKRIWNGTFNHRLIIDNTKLLWRCMCGSSGFNWQMKKFKAVLWQCLCLCVCFCLCLEENRHWPNHFVFVFVFVFAFVFRWGYLKRIGTDLNFWEASHHSALNATVVLNTWNYVMEYLFWLTTNKSKLTPIIYFLSSLLSPSQLFSSLSPCPWWSWRCHYHPSRSSTS